MNKMNKYVRWALTAAGIIVLYIAFSWLYTNMVIRNARADGVYPSAEAGMLALMDKHYPPDHEVEIFYAGPNDNYGNNPYVWYVIAEVHASARADGSELGRNGCDNPGTFFLQLKDGSWVHVGEGFFTTFMTSWMKTFDLAGEGQSTPSTDLLHGPTQFCR
jgi:hypothetical protein